MPNDDLERHKNVLDDEEKIETTFRRLRRNGHSRLEAVQMILDVLDLSLAEAKRILITSDTWADARNDRDSAADSPTSSVPPAPG